MKRVAGLFALAMVLIVNAEAAEPPCAPPAAPPHHPPPHHPPPDGPPESFKHRELRLREALRNGDITPDEAAEIRRQRLLLRAEKLERLRRLNEIDARLQRDDLEALEAAELRRERRQLHIEQLEAIQRLRARRAASEATQASPQPGPAAPPAASGRDR